MRTRETPDPAAVGTSWGRLLLRRQRGLLYVYVEEQQILVLSRLVSSYAPQVEQPSRHLADVSLVLA